MIIKQKWDNLMNNKIKCFSCDKDFDVKDLLFGIYCIKCFDKKIDEELNDAFPSMLKFLAYIFIFFLILGICIYVG